MKFERKGAKPIDEPTSSQLNHALRNMNSAGRSSFGTLTAEDGSYIQFTGGPTLFLLERHDVDGSHFRARQLREPVVPFETGTTLESSAGSIPMHRLDWFLRDQVVKLLKSFRDGQPTEATASWTPLDGSFRPLSPSD